MLFQRIVTALGIRSLKGRLQLSFVCLLIILVILGTVPLYIVGKKQRLELASSEINKMINLQQVVVNNWLNEKLADIKTIAEIPGFKNKEITKMTDVLEVFGSNHKDFSAVIYADAYGITKAVSVGEVGEDISSRQYFIESKKGNTFISDVFVGRKSNKPIITISTPVYDSYGKFNGVIFGTIPLENINPIMSQFEDESRETYLVDKNGMLITNSRQGKIGEKINTKAYANALKGNRLDEFYDTNNGYSVLGDYRWVHSNKWIIIGEIKKDEIYSPLIRMAIIYAIELVMLGLVGWLLVSRMSLQIERPINKLLQGTSKIGEGNLKFRLQSNNEQYEAKEFQEINHNFNSMVELLEKYIKSIGESEERFRMIAEYSSDIITIHDTKGKYLYISPAGKEILQYEDEEVIGFDNLHFTHPEDLHKIKDDQTTFKKVGYAVFTYRMRCKDGNYVWLESSAKRLRGESNEDSRTLVISRNITERKETEQRLEEANKLLQELSLKDGLLGIWNRRAFDEQIENEWNRLLRKSAPLSLLMIDIDHFKAYNDTYGHQAGDDCLKKVSAIVLNCVKRAGDMVFRYGGEEFCVILTNTNTTGAEKVAEEIRKAVEDRQIPHRGSKISDVVTVSIGTNTVVPNENSSAGELILGADKALYSAKENGRNKVETFLKI